MSGRSAQLATVHLQPPGAGDLGIELDQGFPLTVGSVRDDGPAATAGIRAGDAIVALDGRAIGQPAKGGVRSWIMSQPIGAAIRITVRRGTELRTLRVVIGHSLVSPWPGRVPAVRRAMGTRDAPGMAACRTTASNRNQHTLQVRPGSGT